MTLLTILSQQGAAPPPLVVHGVVVRALRRSRRKRQWQVDAEQDEQPALIAAPVDLEPATRPLPPSLARLVDVPADPDLLRAAGRLERAADALALQRIAADALAAEALQMALAARRLDDEEAALVLLLL